ncbi:MAG: YdcF family protein [Pleurocapsa sp.]
MVKKAKRRLWGVIDYRPRWGLTVFGWLIIWFGIGLAITLILFKLQPFLAHNQPIAADVLVVEGWLGDQAIQDAMVEFDRGNYKLLITTGVPLGRGEYLTEYKNFAIFAQASFVAMGFEPDKLQAIPAPDVGRDRTLSTAIAVKDWLEKSNLQVDAINIYTDDVHTRRSWILFKKVFEPEIAVGAIAHPPVDYDPKFWWASSAGFRKILSESIAYIYAKFL